MTRTTDGRQPGRIVPVGLVLVVTAGTLAVGLLLKHPCALEPIGGDAFQLCHSEVLTFYEGQEMDRGRLPYLQPCEDARALCDEYPVLTMYAMRGAAASAGDASTFFFVTAVLLAGCALLTVTCMNILTPGSRRVLLFAFAPSLALWAFISWDLIAVALAMGATLAVVRDRPALAGALIGLGAAAKLYPVILLVPFVIELLRRGAAKRILPMLAWTGGAWLAVNLPFAVAAPDGWWTFFRFNAERPADYNSLWYVACRFGAEGGVSCPWEPAIINLGSAVAFGVGTVLVLTSTRGRDARSSALHLALPLLILFLLTNKVFSPQFSLWLLPWLAYTLRDLRLFAAFSVADIGVWWTGFLWFGRLARDTGQPGFETFSGMPIEAYQAALIARAAVLLLILITWFRSSPPVQTAAHTLGARSIGSANGD